MLRGKRVEALKDLSGLVWVGAVVLAKGPFPAGWRSDSPC